MAKLTITSKYKMNSGYEIPILGFGTAGEVADNYTMAAEESFAANVCALTSGYRHLDSARLYGSEGPCGESIRQSAIPRSEIFVTSKVSQGGYAETRAAVADSLKDSGLEYLDLYLVHSPYGGPEARKGAWRALVEAQKEGKVRSIGVSNYGVQHLEETENYIKELEKELGKGNAGVISVGQWELHPWLPRKDIVAWCQERNIVIEAYCPLIRGKRFDEPVLQPLINKYNKSAAQVLLRWSLQKGFIPLPKSITPSRIESNARIYDFELTGDEMASLELDEYAPCTWDPTVSGLDNYERG